MSERDDRFKALLNEPIEVDGWLTWCSFADEGVVVLPGNLNAVQAAIFCRQLEVNPRGQLLALPFHRIGAPKDVLEWCDKHIGELVKPENLPDWALTVDEMEEG